MITFRCAQCAKALSVKDELAGKRARCPHCGGLTPIPAHTAAGQGATGTGQTLASRLPSAPPVNREAATIAPSVVPPRLVAADQYETLSALPGQGQETAGGHIAQDGGLAEAIALLAPAKGQGELGWLGSYRVLKVLGQGGMGTVFQAEDPELKRQVALKIMQPAVAASEPARQRFLREAQAAAALEHDHIITIYHVGQARGVPYLAMPLLQGESLEDRVQREGKLPVPEVLRIGREVAEGLAAAHARGLIHRDIKPANLWLEARPAPMAGQQSAQGGRVKILDFGLARSGDEQNQLTQQGAVVGTPAYMGPEQANGQKVGPPGDLFSLGCVLYRLATGTPPFRGADMISTLVAVATHHPPAPQQLNREVPAALSDLIMKLLAKEPSQRPASAGSVAQSLAAIEQGRMPPAGHRQSATSAAGTAVLRETTVVRREGRRPPWLIPAVAAAVLVAVGLGVFAIVQWATRPGATVADNGKNAPPPKEESAGPRSWPAYALDGLQHKDLPITLLRAAGEGNPDEAPPELVAVLGDARLRMWGNPSRLACATKSNRVAVASYDGESRLWDLDTGQELMSYRNPTGVAVLTINSTGSVVVWIAAWQPVVKVWKEATGKVTEMDVGGVGSLSLSADGSLLAVGHGPGGVDVWDLGTGKAKELDWKPKAEVGPLVFHPGGKMLASGNGKGEVWLWNLDTGKGQLLGKHAGPVMSLAFSPDGKAVAAGSDQGSNISTVKVWEVDSGKELATLDGHDQRVYSVAFSPNGKYLASGCYQWPSLWELSYPPKRRDVHDNFTGPNPPQVGFSPDSRTLIAACHANRGAETIWFWDVASGKPMQPLDARQPQLTAVALSPDGKAIFLGDWTGQVKRWDVAGGKETLLGSHGHRVTALQVSADGSVVASLHDDGTAKYWDVAAARERFALEKNTQVARLIGFAANGKELLGLVQDGKFRRWDTSTGLVLSAVGPDAPLDKFLAITRDRKFVALREGNLVRLIDPAGKEVTHFEPPPELSEAVFSPDGKLLATGHSAKDIVKLWDTATGADRGELKDMTWPAQLTFSPDGQTLTVVSKGILLNFWDPKTRLRSRRAIQFGPVGGRCGPIVYSPDGRYLGTVNSNGTAHIFRLAPAASQ